MVNIPKFAAYLVFFSTLTCYDSAAAEKFGNARVELARYTSMGGVDITCDEDTPANAYLTKPGFTVFGLGIETTISRFITMADVGVEAANMDWYIDTNNQIESLHNLAYELKQLSALMGDSDVELEVRSRLDLPNGNIPIGDQSIRIGGYSKSFAAAGIYVPREIGSGINLKGFYLDFGDKTDLVRLGLLTDAGLSVGYALPLPLSARRKVAIGAQLRGFFRIRSDELVVMDKRVWNNDNIAAPHDSNDIEILHGWGSGIDLYTAFMLEDVLGTVLGIYLEDALTGVWYNEGSRELVTPRLGIGASVRPLGKRNGNDLLIVGIDVENLQTLDPTVELGAATILGTKKINIMPTAGVAFNKKNLFGHNPDTAISTGLGSNIASFRLDLAILYNLARASIDGGFYMGVRM